MTLVVANGAKRLTRVYKCMHSAANEVVVNLASYLDRLLLLGAPDVHDELKPIVRSFELVISVCRWC